MKKALRDLIIASLTEEKLGWIQESVSEKLTQALSPVLDTTGYRVVSSEILITPWKNSLKVTPTLRFALNEIHATTQADEYIPFYEIGNNFGRRSPKEQKQHLLELLEKPSERFVSVFLTRLRNYQQRQSMSSKVVIPGVGWHNIEDQRPARFWRETGCTEESFLQPIRDAVQPALSQEITERIEARLHENPLPPMENLVPLRVDSCRCMLELDYQQNLTLRFCIELQYTTRLEKNRTLPIGNLMDMVGHRTDVDALQTEIVKAVFETSRELLPWLREQIPTWELTGPPEYWQEQERKAVWTLLQTGCFEMDNLLLQMPLEQKFLNGKSPSQLQVFLFPDESVLLKIRQGADASIRTSLPLGLSSPEGSPSLLSLVRAMVRFSAIYAEFQKEHDDFRFPLTFNLKDGKLTTAETELTGQYIRDSLADILRNPDETGRSILREAYAHALEIEKEKQERELERQARLEQLEKDLCSFNEVEVKILKYIYGLSSRGYWHHTTTKTSLLEKFGTHPTLTTAAIGRSIDSLIWKKLSMEDGDVDLIETGWSSNRYGEYQTFGKNPEIPVAYINRLVPRPLQMADFTDMKVPARLPWLEEEAKKVIRSGDPERCWTFFNEMQEYVPKVTIAAFVKTQTGQDCFQMLQGADREYARLLLEDLPGCKRLVRQMFPEEKSENSETEASETTDC